MEKIIIILKKADIHGLCNDRLIRTRTVMTFDIKGSPDLYDNYSMGLTIISVISIIFCLLSPKKHNQFLAAVFLVLLNIPFIVYLLNMCMIFTRKSSNITI